MPEPTPSGSVVPRLVILLSSGSFESPQSLLVALRYATTAAAMDVAVELHAVSQSIVLLRKGAADPALLDQIRQAVALGVEIFACPVALTEHGLKSDELIGEVCGVRGAPSLLVAGLAPGARFLVF